MTSKVVNELLETATHRLVIGVTLSGPDAFTAWEMIQEFLDHLPERTGRVTIHDLRVLRGMVDRDDVPLKVSGTSYDSMR